MSLNGRSFEQVEPGTDRWAIGQNLVSMTPLLLDLTDHQQLADAAARQPLDENQHDPAFSPAKTSFSP